MKKLFALFMVVAMLSVAGSAMATTITADRSEVTLQRGGTASFTFTGAVSHNGTLSYNKVSGASWATLIGTTLNVTVPSSAPAGDYPVIVRTVETYVDADTAGHSATKTDTADVTVTIHVEVPRTTPNTSGGSAKASSNVVVVVLEKVKKIVAKVPAPEKVNEVTATQAKTESKRKNTVTTKKVSIVSKIRNAVASAPILNNATLLIKTVVATKTELVEKFSATIQNKLEAKAPVLGAAIKKLAQIIPPMSTTESGFVAQDMTFGSEYYGQLIGYDLNPLGLLGASFSAADANGDNDAVFLDSTGTEVTRIPDGTGSADAGVVTAVVYLEAGEEYEPYVFVEIPQTEVAAFEESTGATEKTVELTTIVVDSVTVNTTDNFNPVVSLQALAAISNDYGKPVQELPYDAASTTETWATTADELAYKTAQSMDFVCSLPVLNVVSDGVYVVNVIFDNTPSAAKFTAPVFYPNGVMSIAAKSAVYTLNAGTATKITDANAKDIVVNGRSVYLVFEVANNAVVADYPAYVAASDFEAADVTLGKPVLVVKEISSGSDTPGGNTPGGNTPGGNTPGGNTGDPTGVGSSSGGCSAGSAVLAMAVLGAFIATRKK